MAETGTTRSFGNMLNQKPVKGGKTGKKGSKSPWMGMKKTTKGEC